MTSRRLIPIVAMAVLGTVTLLLAAFPLRLAQPGAALNYAAPTTKMRTLHAFFTNTDSSGVVTDVDVNATVGPGGGEATIEVSRYRPTCENNGCPQLLSHSFNRVPVAANELLVTGQLDSATLRTTGKVRQRLTTASDMVTLDLSWKGEGRIAEDEHEEGESFRRARASGAIRSGNVNFTPNASAEAQVEEW